MPTLRRLLLGLALLAPLTAQEPPLWLRTPAISPDGRTLAFSYQGNLYRVPAAGGTAVPLTLGESHAFSPVWSPDGTWIAFASDRSGNLDVYLMPAEGGPAKRLTYHSAPDLPSAFTPDGKAVLFTSPRLAPADYAQFPYRAFAETYTVPVAGGAARMLTPTTLQAGVFDAKGGRVLYQDLKGGENAWRKHQTSAVAKDLGLYNVAAKRFRTLTRNPGDDRNPAFAADGETFWFLSERDGQPFNVYRATLADPDKAVPVTRFAKHPVRFLSAAKDGTLAFAWDGELYTQKGDAAPRKVDLRIQVDPARSAERFLPVNSGLTELEVSPSGKEVAFVVRGEVFVASLEGGHTRRITDTPSQERSVSFSPDGRTLVYAGERDGSWNVYSAKLVRKDETTFYAATQVEEKALVATAAEEFQPLFSPDGKELAYLEERTTIRVLNLASGKVRTVLPGDRNYSYSDGDQDFSWSPDGKWLVVGINVGLSWLRDVALVSADGSGKLVNLSRSGNFDARPRFSADGSLVYWVSDREGFRNLNQQPATFDVYGLFLTQKALDRHRLGKEEFALLKEREDKEAKDKAKEEKKDEKKEEKKEERKDLAIEWEGLEDRIVRLSAHTAELGDAVLSKAGDKLLYMARFEKGFDLWSLELRTRETKLLAKLDARAASMRLSADGKSLLVRADGRAVKLDAESGKRDAVALNGEMRLREAEERAAIYEHAWRQLEKKFYVKDLHGVDWPFYVKAYRRFLPHVGNNHDFAELLSELLGELNASHTGGRYAAPQEGKDATASLGLFFDPAHDGRGLKVTEVLKKGPLDRAGVKVRPGHLLLAIDGVEITPAADPSALLNRKAGRPTLLAFQDGAERYEETAKPIPAMQENELLYQRWVERSRARVEKLSGGRLGYVHVRGMNDPSMRTVFDEVLGQHLAKEGLVVDTRFNGGGNLHEQLSDFLSGRKYFDVVPRGMAYGHQPMMKWTKPSIVVMGEGNYSDAHLFPVAYKLKGLGKTVGMPVPGTGTFVWWETQIDPTLVFGIPQGGWRTPDGKFCENTQLEPDLRVANTPESLAANRDLQLEAAVQDLLGQVSRR